MNQAEINCPKCNPEAKPRIRRLNKPSVCLICYNEGWTTADKVCRCGQPSGIYPQCDAGTDTAINVTERNVPLPAIEGGPFISGTLLTGDLQEAIAQRAVEILLSKRRPLLPFKS